MAVVHSAVRPLADATTLRHVFGTMKHQRGFAPAPALRREMEVKRAAGVARCAAPVHDANRTTFRKRQTDAPCVEFMDHPKRVKLMPVSNGPERLKKRVAAEFDALRELVKKAEALSRGGNNRRFLAAESRPVTKRIKTSPLVEQIDVPRKSKTTSVQDEEIDISGGVVTPVAIRVAAPRTPVQVAKPVEQSSQTCSSLSSISRDKSPCMSPEEGEIIVPPEEEEEAECVDICGGVSPIAIRHDATPLEVACSPTSSSSSDSGSSSSSDSDSGNDSDDSISDSDSDEEVESTAKPAAVPPEQRNIPAPPDKKENVYVTSTPPEPEPVHSTETESISGETVTSPAPPSVLSKKIINSPAKSPAPAPLTVVQSTQTEKKNLPISVLLARAKEAREIREQRGNGWEREKTRRMVREMEKTVLPDETISSRDLEEIGIVEFKYVLGKLGIALRPDV